MSGRENQCWRDLAQGWVVFLDSSVLVTVPSDDWVTVFSFDLTVPSLLTLLVSVWETSRAHPISNESANVATQTTAKLFLMLCFIGGKIRAGWLFTIGDYPDGWSCQMMIIDIALECPSVQLVWRIQKNTAQLWLT
jgi:hypothetical protein